MFTYFGREVGRFDAEEVYGSNGRDLGEVMNENRLITCVSKKNWVRASFAPRSGGSYARYANFARNQRQAVGVLAHGDDEEG